MISDKNRISSKSRRRRNGTDTSHRSPIMNQLALASTLMLLVNADSRGSSSIHISTDLGEKIEHPKTNTNQLLLQETGFGAQQGQKYENEITGRILTSYMQDNYRLGTRRGKGSKRSGSSGNNIFDHASSYSSTKASSSSSSYSSSYTYKSSKKQSSGDGFIQMPTFPPVIDWPTISPTTRSPTTPIPTKEPPRDIPTDPPFFRPTPSPPPTPRPTGTVPQNTQCVVNNEGLFGAQIGVAEVISFGYEVTVSGTPSVEEQISIVSVMEEGITNEIIDDLFQQCSTSSVATFDEIDQETEPPRGHYHQGSRSLQQNTFSGVSSRPKDQIVDGKLDSCSFVNFCKTLQ